MLHSFLRMHASYNYAHSDWKNKLYKFDYLLMALPTPFIVSTHLWALLNSCLPYMEWHHTHHTIFGMAPCLPYHIWNGIACTIPYLEWHHTYHTIFGMAPHHTIFGMTPRPPYHIWNGTMPTMETKVYNDQLKFV